HMRLGLSERVKQDIPGARECAVKSGCSGGNANIEDRFWNESKLDQICQRPLPAWSSPCPADLQTDSFKRAVDKAFDRAVHRPSGYRLLCPPGDAAEPRRTDAIITAASTRPKALSCIRTTGLVVGWNMETISSDDRIPQEKAMAAPRCP